MPPSSRTTAGRSGTAGVPKSPFFRPSDPRKKLHPVSTPGGTVRLQRKKVEAEHKSSIVGASSNLVVSIVGAGIVGIPYALQQSGLVAGILLVIIVAVITEKSLRLLIDTAKHVNVPSYETLYEASFGYRGFLAMSLFMFTMAYGAMTSYMMIMKDSLAFLLGIPDDDLGMKRMALTIATALFLFPLSAQRDMADLAKTSKISVSFYIFIVAFVVYNSPVSTTVEQNGGWNHTITSSLIKPETMFTGLGVLSFAFVCQHSAFIIAGSLERPTRSRWANVTGLSLFLSGFLASSIGLVGYLGFSEETQGNILNNFDSDNRVANIARGTLLCCMFCVYPMDSFVSRHVCVVLFFKGRQAHEGDDHSVLARTDRRVLVTLVIYLLTLMPALILEDLGSVLAVTGAIAGSFLSYIGPGTSYLAVHGEEFLKLCGILDSDGNDMSASSSGDNILVKFIKGVVWYITFMPIWVRIAQIGKFSLEQHYEEEALKSPHPNRLGNFKHAGDHQTTIGQQQTRTLMKPSPAAGGSSSALGTAEEGRSLVRTLSIPRNSINVADDSGVAYGSTSTTSLQKPSEIKALIKPIGDLNNKTKQQQQQDDEEEIVEEDDPQEAFPKVYDFVVAISYIVFGLVAMIAGLFSILNEGGGVA